MPPESGEDERHRCKHGLQATGGRVGISPLRASFYGCTLTGSLGNSTTHSPRITATEKLSCMAMGPLLEDAIDKTPIDGKDDVTFDINTSVSTAQQFKKAVVGSARVVLQDGAINGINLAAAIRNTKAKLG